MRDLFADGAAKQRLLLPLFICLYIGMSLFVFGIFLRGSEFGGVYGRSAAAMVDQTAYRPAVYRVLVPTIARGIITLTPDFMREGMNQWLADKRDHGFWFQVIIRSRYEVPPASLSTERIYDTSVVLLVTYLSLCAYVFLIYKLAAFFWPENRGYRLVAPLIGLMMIPPFHDEFAYIYDYPSMMFVAAAMYALVKNKVRAYWVILILATLNRESAVYLVALYALYSFRWDNARHCALNVVAQFLLVLLIQGWIRQVYSSNPGEDLYDSLFWQLAYIFGKYNVLQITQALVFIGLVFYRWTEKPFMLRAGLCLLPIMFVAYLMHGYRNEYRVFMEIFPVISLLFTHSILRGCKLDELPIFAQPAESQDGA